MKTRNFLKKAFLGVAFLMVLIVMNSCAKSEYSEVSIWTDGLDVALEVEDFQVEVSTSFKQKAWAARYNIDGIFSTEDNTAYVTVVLSDELIENDIEPVVIEREVIDTNTELVSVTETQVVTLDDGQVATITKFYSFVEFTDTYTGETKRFPYTKIIDVDIDDIEWASAEGEYQQEIPVSFSYVEVEQTTSTSIDEADVDISSYSVSTASMTAVYTKVGEVVTEEPEVDPEPVVEVTYVASSKVFWEDYARGVVTKTTTTDAEVTGTESLRSEKVSISVASVSVGDTTSSSDVLVLETASASILSDTETVSGYFTIRNITRSYVNTITDVEDNILFEFEQYVKMGTVSYDDGVMSYSWDFTFEPKFELSKTDTVDGVTTYTYSYGGTIATSEFITSDSGELSFYESQSFTLTVK